MACYISSLNTTETNLDHLYTFFLQLVRSNDIISPHRIRRDARQQQTTHKQDRKESESFHFYKPPDSTIVNHNTLF